MFTEVFKAPEFCWSFEYLFGEDYALKSITKTENTVRMDIEKNPDHRQGLGTTSEFNFIESVTNTLGYYCDCDYVQIFVNDLPYESGHLEIPAKGFRALRYETAIDIKERKERPITEDINTYETVYHPENRESFMFGVAPFYDKTLHWGFMDHYGNTVIEPIWESYEFESQDAIYYQAPFSEGLALVF